MWSDQLQFNLKIKKGQKIQTLKSKTYDPPLTIA